MLLATGPAALSALLFLAADVFSLHHARVTLAAMTFLCVLGRAKRSFLRGLSLFPLQAASLHLVHLLLTILIIPSTGFL